MAGRGCQNALVVMGVRSFCLRSVFNKYYPFPPLYKTVKGAAAYGEYLAGRIFYRSDIVRVLSVCQFLRQGAHTSNLI